jgi:hypothetical protein
MEHPIITCVGFDRPSDDPFRLMGNALFYDDYTIILDFQNSRMGIVSTAIGDK